MTSADWVMEVFTRPATEADYHLSPDHDPPHGDDLAAMAEHLGWLLSAPGERLADYDDLAVASGLKWIFDSAETWMARGLGHSAVTQDRRLSVIAGIGRLWPEIFAPRCPEALGHLSEDGGPLGLTCYMFWDLFYIDRSADAREAEAVDEAVMAAMETGLSLPHAACQESALHGLGHAAGNAPGRVAAIIDRWLAEGRAARPELVAYARAARTGCVL